MEKLKFNISFLLFFISGIPAIKAQTITALWTGKINQHKVEVKIILKGGSVTGTTHYYESSSNYRRFSIKGYFDNGSNEAVWWDDQLIEEKGHGPSAGQTALFSRADFNCPGYGRMVLGEKTFKAGDENEWPGERNLDKTDCSNCTDEFEFVLENFTVDANDAEVADSVGLLAAKKTIEDQPMKLFWKVAPVISMSEPALAQTGFSTKDSAVTVLPVEPIVPSPIEQKYIARKKVFATEIPVSGDSIELHFYDNGQVDGDSISLFLNDKLIFEHIRLTDKAYLIKLAVTDLNTTNELIMVAENLGSISPNTSYMIATIGDQKYEARLESTEGSSALIRLVKPTDQR